LFSRIALNQRAYIGSSIGDARRPDALWWVQASAALGTPAGLGFDVGGLDGRTLGAFRADLRAVDPFMGTTTYEPGLFPDAFATTRDGLTYLGVVNRENGARGVPISLRALGLNAPSYVALDVTAGQASVVTGDFSPALPARSFRYFVLRPDPGVLRTDSVVSDLVTDVDAGLVAMTARGPSEAPGFAQIVVPPFSTVLVDGVPASRSQSPASTLLGSPPTTGISRYTYDAGSGLLTISYTHSGTRSIEIRW